MTFFLIQLCLLIMIIFTSWLTIRSLNPFKLAKRPSNFVVSLAYATLTALLFFVLLTSFSYQLTEFKERVAKVSATQTGIQEYDLAIDIKREGRHIYQLKGDMWQIDFRLIAWSKFWGEFGLHTLYQFDRLSGRYASVAEEQKNIRTVYDLSSFKYGNELHKVWKALAALNLLPGLEAKYGNAAYVPLKDGAEYEVIILRSGVQIRPLNKEANEVIDLW